MSKKKKQQVIDAFKSADKNGDGKIDLEEYVQHFKVCNLQSYFIALNKLPYLKA